MLDRSGQRVGQYELHELIGSGGYGAVYRAREFSVDRDVAVKVILPEHSSKDDFQQRFESEARIVALLEHPHIIPLYNFWQDEGGAYLVMRYVDGGSLRDWIEQQGALSLAHCSRLIDQIADALEVAHDAGVVHRDLKPDNILLDERSNAYLTDFGIAKRLDNSADGMVSNTDSITGTFAYLAPEQIQNEPITPKTDVYALGVMLHEMLMGVHAYRDLSAVAMLMKHLQEDLPLIREERSDLPPDVDRIIQAATSKLPEDRYASVQELAADLRSVNQSAARVSTERRSASRLQRRSYATPEQRNRHAMLQNVHSFWIQGVLDNSLHGTALIELGMQQEQGAVDNPWDAVLQQPGMPDEEITQDESVLHVFERLNGKLLILGNPGSGKTTTLLSLTRDLLRRAEADEQHPIPAVFNLSSWSEHRKPLEEWLVEELIAKYQVPPPVSESWVKEDRLLLLLDGLDEVALEHRNACVDTINHYRKEHGFVDVVVCSRTKDYEALSSNLLLNGAVALQPLDDEQIDRYLQAYGKQANVVSQMLEDDEHLQELVRSPLMLSIVVLAYRDVELEDVQHAGDIEAQRAYIFHSYVRQMFKRRGQGDYSQQDSMRYLAALAWQMREQAQSLFIIEKIQPDWLPEVQRRGFYLTTRFIHSFTSAVFEVVMFFLFGLILGLPLIPFALAQGFAGLVVAWIFTGNEWKNPFYHVVIGSTGIFTWGLTSWMAYGAEMGIFAGTIGSVTYGLYHYALSLLYKQRGSDQDHITTVEVLSFQPKQMKLWYAALSFVYGVAFVYMVATVGGIRPDASSLVPVFVGLGGLTMGLGALFFSGLTSGEVQMRTRPNQGIRASLANANRAYLFGIVQFSIAGFIGVYPLLDVDLLQFVISGLGFSVAVGLTIWSVFGGINVVQHVALRRTLHNRGLIPRNYADFLDFASSLILMRKVGGGYIFIHRYLLEYFADLHSDTAQ